MGGGRVPHKGWTLTLKSPSMPLHQSLNAFICKMQEGTAHESALGSSLWRAEAGDGDHRAVPGLNQNRYGRSNPAPRGNDWSRMVLCPVAKCGAPHLLDLVEMRLVNGVLELERHIVRVADLHRLPASAHAMHATPTHHHCAKKPPHSFATATLPHLLDPQLARIFAPPPGDVQPRFPAAAAGRSVPTHRLQTPAGTVTLMVCVAMAKVLPSRGGRTTRPTQTTSRPTPNRVSCTTF